MNLKKLGTALVVVVALGAVMASSASAAAITTDVQWRDSAGVISTPQSMKLTATDNFILKSTISGSPLELKSTQVRCTGCTISNSGGTAVGSGVIVFENVTVPSNPLCAVPGGEVTTNTLEIQADWMISTRNFVKFFPAGGGTTFATVEIVKGTGTCPIKGSYGVTGVVFGETEPTKTQREDQPVKFSGLINQEASGLTEPLKFKAEPATLNGAATASTVTATMKFWTE